MEKPTVIVVGNGMVGYKFCERLTARSSDFNIIVFGEEPRHAYDRVHLSEYFNGKSADDLSLSKFSWYKDNDIQLHLGDPVQEINRTEKTVHSSSGIVFKYDYLVLATGSAPFVPDIPGIGKEGILVYRTIDDLELMQAYGGNAKTAAVLGGGLLGLEAAKALIDLGITTTHVIEFAPRLMPRQIDGAGSLMLQSKLSELGLRCISIKALRISAVNTK